MAKNKILHTKSVFIKNIRLVTDKVLAEKTYEVLKNDKTNSNISLLFPRGGSRIVTQC